MPPGYDGIVLENTEFGCTSYIAFSEDQIRIVKINRQKTVFSRKRVRGVHTLVLHPSRIRKSLSCKILECFRGFLRIFDEEDFWAFWARRVHTFSFSFPRIGKSMQILASEGFPVKFSLPEDNN